MRTARAGTSAPPLLLAAAAGVLGRACAQEAFCWPSEDGLPNFGDDAVRTEDGPQPPHLCPFMWCKRAFDAATTSAAAASGDCRCEPTGGCEAGWSGPGVSAPSPAPPPSQLTVRMWWLIIPIILYGLVCAGMLILYHHLRSRHRILFEKLKAEGEIKTHGEELIPSTKAASIGQMIFGEFFGISKKELAQKLGPDAGVYLAHLKQCGLFFAAHSCTTAPILMNAYRSGSGAENLSATFPDDAFFKFTAGNLGDNDEFRKFIVVAFSWIMMASSIAFAYRNWKILENFKFTSATITHSTTTVMISNLPREIVNDKLLQRYFAMTCPQQVAGMKVALAVHDLAVNVRLQNKCIKAINVLREKNEWLYQEDAFGTTDEEKATRSEHTALLKEYSELHNKWTELREVPPKGAGCAFVTFKSEQWAAKFMYEARINKGYVAGDCRASADILLALRRSEWKIQMAPLHHDIYWENIATTPDERNLRRVISNGILCAGLTGLSGAVMAGVVFIGFDYIKIAYDLDPESCMPVGPEVNSSLCYMQEESSTTCTLASGGTEHYNCADLCESGIRHGSCEYSSLKQFLQGLHDTLGGWYYPFMCVPPPLAFLLCAETLCPAIQLVSGYEHTQTRTKKQASYLTKCYFYYLCLHLACGTVGWWELAQHVNASNKMRVFVDLAGLYHCNKFFLEILFYLPYRVLEGYSNFFRPTQQVADTEYGTAAEEDDRQNLLLKTYSVFKPDRYYEDSFDYSRQYGESIALFCMVQVYAISVPLIIPIASAWFLIKYVVDKYILARQYSRARISFGRRARMITKWTILSVVFGQFALSYFLSYMATNMESEANGVQWSAYIALAAFVVYSNRKIKIFGIEINVVVLVMKHSRFEKFMPEQITNVVKDFNENNGEDEEDEDDKPKATAKQDTRSEASSEIYDVPTIENLRPTVQLLTHPGADVTVHNPLSDSPVAGAATRGPSLGGTPHAFEAANIDHRGDSAEAAKVADTMDTRPLAGDGKNTTDEAMELQEESVPVAPARTNGNTNSSKGAESLAANNDADDSSGGAADLSNNLEHGNGNGGLKHSSGTRDGKLVDLAAVVGDDVQRAVVNPLTVLAELPREPADGSDSSYDSEEDWGAHMNGARHEGDYARPDDLEREYGQPSLDGFLADDIEEEV